MSSAALNETENSSEDRSSSMSVSMSIPEMEAIEDAIALALTSATTNETINSNSKPPSCPSSQNAETSYPPKAIDMVTEESQSQSLTTTRDIPDKIATDGATAMALPTTSPESTPSTHEDTKRTTVIESEGSPTTTATTTTTTLTKTETETLTTTAKPKPKPKRIQGILRPSSYRKNRIREPASASKIDNSIQPLGSTQDSSDVNSNPVISSSKSNTCRRRRNSNRQTTTAYDAYSDSLSFNSTFNASEYTGNYQREDQNHSDAHIHIHIDGDSNSSIFLKSMLWCVIVLPVVLLTFLGLPYLLLGSLVWTIIFVVRWFRNFLREEFSMRRNGLKTSATATDNCTTSLLTAATRNFRSKHSIRVRSTTNNSNRKQTIPLTVESPFCSMMLASTVPSPEAKTRSRKVRFEPGIKCPTRRFLRQPVPRIKKIPQRPMKKTRPRLFADQGVGSSFEGDSTWNLDNLMILKNYMNENNNNDNSNPSTTIHTDRSVDASSDSEPTTTEPLPFAEDDASVQVPQIYPLTANTSVEKDVDAVDEDNTGDGSEERNPQSACFKEDQNQDHPTDNGQDGSVATDHASCPQFSARTPQEIIQEEDTAYETRYGHHCQQAIVLEDEENDDRFRIEDFEEGLFGVVSSSSSSIATRTKQQRRASNYRRRRPRDSLCFFNSKNTTPLECPAIPPCPSDEQDFLQQKIRENFEKAVIVESSSVISLHQPPQPSPPPSLRISSSLVDPTIQAPASSPASSPASLSPASSSASPASLSPASLSPASLPASSSANPAHETVFQLPPWKSSCDANGSETYQPEYENDKRIVADETTRRIGNTIITNENPCVSSTQELSSFDDSSVDDLKRQTSDEDVDVAETEPETKFSHETIIQSQNHAKGETVVNDAYDGSVQENFDEIDGFADGNDSNTSLTSVPNEVDDTNVSVSAETDSPTSNADCNACEMQTIRQNTDHPGRMEDQAFWKNLSSPAGISFPNFSESSDDAIEEVFSNGLSSTLDLSRVPQTQAEQNDVLMEPMSSPLLSSYDSPLLEPRLELNLDSSPFEKGLSDDEMMASSPVENKENVVLVNDGSSNPHKGRGVMMVDTASSPAKGMEGNNQSQYTATPLSSPFHRMVLSPSNANTIGNSSISNSSNSLATLSNRN